MTLVSRIASAFVCAAIILAAGNVLAQSQAGRNQEMQLPPGSPVISISAMMPQELRVGEQFEYQIQVRNLSDNVAIHDLVLEQQKSDALQIESARMEAAQGQKQASKQQPNNEQSQKQAQQQGQASEQQAASSQQSQQSQTAAQQGQKQNQWTISMLGPGETQTIHVTAIAEKEGQANACLIVTDFKPSLCLRTEFVKPDLELVKNAPAEANLCEDIEVDYYVKNIGTGNAGQFVIRDPLGKGLKTIDGDDKLEFSVDGLEEGEVRKFVASLRAEKAGTFSSRAVAVMEEGGGKTNSNKTSTDIRQADLAVQIDGPDTHYLGRPANYTILVANRGNAPAVDATLLANFADGADIVRAGEVRSADPSALKQAASGGKAPTPAQVGQASQSDGQNQQAQANQGQDAQPQNQKNQQQAASQQQPQQQANGSQPRQGTSQVTAAEADKTWELGTLQPGQAVRIPVTVRLRQPGSLTHVAEAQFVCGDGANRDAARAVAQQQTELIALPDLMLAVVDNEGTVPQGEQVSYTIIVKNQGEAADQNIQITAELPQGLEFVSADGPTQPKNEGQSLNFPAIKSLEPGDRVVWQVTAKATGEGQVLFRTKLDSEAMTQPATAEEPTRLVAQTAQADQQSQQQ
jgi:uncharacterized repeat protein (TIGR01451 family)